MSLWKKTAYFYKQHFELFQNNHVLYNYFWKIISMCQLDMAYKYNVKSESHIYVRISDVKVSSFGARYPLRYWRSSGSQNVVVPISYRSPSDSAFTGGCFALFIIKTIYFSRQLLNLFKFYKMFTNFQYLTSYSIPA